MKTIIVTEEMRLAGENIANALIHASVSKSMGGLSGSKTWEEYLNNFNDENLDLILQYLDNKIDSVTAIFIAMQRKS